MYIIRGTRDSRKDRINTRKIARKMYEFMKFIREKNLLNLIISLIISDI